MELINEFELEKMMQLEKDDKVTREDINDITLKKTVGYYDFLTNNIMSVSSKEGKNKAMYSKYYWYTKYKKRYFELYGYDAGIEQEGFKLLEELENELEEGVNWTIIQKIEENEK